MAVRPLIDDLVQLAPEATEGDGAASTKRVPDLNIAFGYNATFKDIQGSGYSLDLGTSPGQEWGTFTGGGQGSYNGIVYPLNSLLKKVSASSGGATSKIWTFDWTDFGANAFQTYCFEKGQTVAAEKIAGARFTDFSMKMTPDEASWTGGGIGGAIQRGITMTPTGVTEVAVRPMVPKTFDVYLDPSAATLGTTKLLLAFEFDWGISKIAGPLNAMNSANNGYAATVKLKPGATATLTISDDSVSSAQITKMRSGTPFFIRVVSQGDLIDTGAPNHYFKFTGDFCVAVNGQPRATAVMGAEALQFPLKIQHDATWGKGLLVVVENLIAAL